ncbi:MAG: ATP-binding protein, partial [Pseudomonadota bacterium]|nr:ATP-binding protein [Pseudomonadota bacterium]
QERFALAVRGSNDGIWDWNVRTDEVWYSPRFLELLGYHEGEFPHVFDSFANALHPDDKERVLEAVQAHLHQGKEYELNYRLLCKDGAYRWFRAAGIAKFECGKPVRMAGSISDISSLVDAREAAEQSSRAKSGFLAHMSHELRTPLNGVLGMARSLRSRPDLDDEIADQVDVITSSADALLQMLNDILDLSKIEAEKIELEQLPFSLNVFADRVASLYSNMAEDKGLQLEVTTDIADGDVRLGDRHRLSQIVDNLIANAIKFTDDGRVSLEIKANAERVEVVVEDTGIGLTDEQLAVIWDKFVQADESTTRRFGGTGLGLSIVRGLVRRMSGTIKVESEFGRGTRFIIDLPLVPTSSSLIEPAGGSGAAADAGSRLAGVRVLAAEDNLTNRLVLKSFLDQTDVDLTLVEDGAAAVEACKSGQFDVLLMDMRMPIMGGVEALENIRRWEREAGRPSVPAIAFTADAMPEQVEEQKRAGFVAHLSKPLNPEQLVSTISAVIKPGQESEERHSA